MVKRFVIALLVALLLVSMNGVATASAAEKSTSWPTVHVVARGETLYSIGRRYGVSAWVIARANGIANPSRIYVGQPLLIPPAEWMPPVGWAGSPTWGAPWGFAVSIHVVARGETLYSIGRSYGVGAWIIARANGLANPSRITIGQRLLIPMLRWDGGATWWAPWGSDGKLHIVVAGETLFSIGRRYGVSPWIIAVVNGLTNPSLITVGQRLVIPPL
jgi:LysM repeat protein